MNFLAFIPFKKELLIGLLCAGVVYFFGQMRYNSGVDDIEAKYTKLNYEQRLVDLAASLEAEKANIKVTTEIITVYKDRVITIEKKVPVYVNKVKEIFSYNDDIVIPPALARLHNVSAENGDGDAFSAKSTDDAAARAVTLGEFAERVIENYGRCSVNSQQLIALQSWISTQEKIYAPKK